MKFKMKKEFIGMALIVVFLIGLYMLNGKASLKTTIKTPIEIQLESHGDIKVYITGEVENPGVYEVSDQERLDVVLALAGGFTEAADTSHVNLARQLKDGEMIVIYSVLSEEVSYIGIDVLNYGTEDVIMSLDGIGQVIAQRIIDYRISHGLFESYEDLLEVEGIGENKLNSIKLAIEDKEN